MSLDLNGRLAVVTGGGSGIGAFLVPTHYNTKDYADERLEEVQAAFETLASIDTRRFDPMEIAAQVLRQ